MSKYLETAASLGRDRPYVATHVVTGNAIFRISALVLILIVLLATKPIDDTLPHYFLYRQDLPVVALILALIAYLLATGGQASRRSEAIVSARGTAWSAAALAGLVAVIGIAGHHLVMWGYALSRDEQMALFDAQVLASGHFAARLPAEWAPYHRALNILFMPESVIGVGWVSIYRPVNALLHALAGMAGDTAWTNPLLAAAGLLATWRVAGRVLPGDRESQFVAVLLYATSTQVLAAAMTSYAMTGHLALNMIWLALFLHDRWYSHLAAIGVGFLAIGLHQLVYHPLFAGPLLFFCLVVQRRWGISAVYALAYAAGILLWSRYTALPLGELGVAGKPSDVDDFLLLRLWWAVSEMSPAYLWIQTANLVRFAAWQNLLFVPLLLAGLAPALRSRDPRLWGMVAAIGVLIVAKLVLRPYQGHGWGFRYMHGLIGVACIVAAVGWRELRRTGALGPRHLVTATAATLFVAMPWLLWQAHHFSGLFARVDRAIAATPADLVIVDNTAPEFTADLVYNLPNVDRRPVRLLASEIGPADLDGLCARASIAFVGARDLAPIAAEFDAPSPDGGGLVPDLRRAAVAANCRIVPLAPIG